MSSLETAPNLLIYKDFFIFFIYLFFLREGGGGGGGGGTPLGQGGGVPPALSKNHANFAVVQGCVLSARVNITKLFFFEGLTGGGGGGIIRPMKSRNQRRIARGLARLLQGARVGTVIARQIACQLPQIRRADFGNIHTEIAGQTPPFSWYNSTIDSMGESIK